MNGRKVKMEKLTKEEVLHVAHLARIEVNDEEIEKYRVQLGRLWNEVEKINEVKSNEEDLFITPIKGDALLRSDDLQEEMPFEEMKKNAKRTSGNFIEVPVMIHE